LIGESEVDMNKTSNMISLIAGLGAGATLMYFADPERGHRRRAIARDKIKSSALRFSKTAAKTRRDMANRVYGVWAKGKNLLSDHLADDPILEQRVRSKMGRVVSHPHAIKVEAADGKVALTGLILSDEINELLRCVRSVPGVKAVENLLECEVPIDRKDREANKVSGGKAFFRPPLIH